MLDTPPVVGSNAGVFFVRDSGFPGVADFNDSRQAWKPSFAGFSGFCSTRFIGSLYEVRSDMHHTYQGTGFAVVSGAPRRSPGHKGGRRVPGVRISQK